MAANPSALPEDHISFPYVCVRRHRTRCGARAAMQGECADLLRRFAAQR